MYPAAPVFDGLMIGQEELCALSEEDLMKEEIVNRIRNTSGLVFKALRQIRLKQPDIRQINISTKRRKSDSLSTNRILFGINPPKKPTRQPQHTQYNSRRSTVDLPLDSQPPSQQSHPPSTSTRRIVSNASIADPNHGGISVWASTEKASEHFASTFMDYVIMWIWPSGITLDWVIGRPGTTVIAWNAS